MLLVFDCDGVLVDSETIHSETEASYARDLLGITRDSKTHHELFVGRGLENVFIAWEKEYGKALPSGFKAGLLARKKTAMATTLQSIPYIGDTLDRLKAYAKCVASGSSIETLDVSLKKTNLFSYFAPHIFSSESVAKGKPAPDIFLYAAEQMKTSPDQCVVIEDSAAGVEAARAAHMRVIGFAGGSHYESDDTSNLKEAEAVIEDMRHLPDLIASMM